MCIMLNLKVEFTCYHCQFRINYFITFFTKMSTEQLDKMTQWILYRLIKNIIIQLKNNNLTTSYSNTV